MEQVREEVAEYGLDGDFWEEGLPSYIQSQLECLHGWNVHNLLWQVVPERLANVADDVCNNCPNEANSLSMLTTTAMCQPVGGLGFKF